MKNRLQPMLRPGLMLAAFAAGVCFPALGETWPIRYLLFGMLLIAFAGMDFRDLALRRMHWMLFALNFAVAAVIGGLGEWLGGDLFGQAAFWVGIAPTAVSAPVIIGLLGGRTGVVLGGVLLTNFGVILALPLLLPWFGGDLSWTTIARMAGDVFLLVGGAFAAAMVLRRLWRGTRETAKKLGNVSFGLWTVNLFVVAAGMSRHLHALPEGTAYGEIAVLAAMSLVVCAMNFFLGYLCCAEPYRREGSQMLGQKNISIVLYLALTYGNPLSALAPTCYILWHNTWNAAQLYAHARRRLRGDSEAR